MAGAEDNEPDSKRIKQEELGRDSDHALTEGGVQVSVLSLSGSKLVGTTVRAQTPLSYLLKQLYIASPLSHPCTVELMHGGRSLRLCNTIADFPVGPLDFSCVYASALAPMAGLQCLCPRDCSQVYASTVRHWMSLYNECVSLARLDAGDALAYILAYEKPCEHYSETANAVLEAASTPMLMMLQFEQEECHEGVMLSASWSNYSLFAPNQALGSWQEVRPTEDVVMWDYAHLWDCKEDIIAAVFDYLHTEEDEVYECKLVWPDQGDGVRINYRTQHGFTSPAQPTNLGIHTARIRR